MTDPAESYLRDLEAAAGAVSAIPDDYSLLRNLLASLPDGTAPDVRSGRTGVTGDVQAVQALTLQSSTPIGSVSGADLGATQTPTLGLGNMLIDARLTSVPTSGGAISLNDGLSHQWAYDWTAIAAFGTTGAAAQIYNVQGLGSSAQNPLAVAPATINFKTWTAAGSATVKAKAALAARTYDPTVLPWAVFSVTLLKKDTAPQHQLFNNCSVATVQLKIRNAADAADLAVSSLVDFKALGSGQYVRLWVAVASAELLNATIAQIEVAVTTTGAAAGNGDFDVVVGDPMIELSPLQTPTLFFPEPAASYVRGFFPTGRTSRMLLYNRFDDASANGRIGIGSTSNDQGVVTWSDGTNAIDVRLFRSAAQVLRLDGGGTLVPATLEMNADFAPVTPPANWGRLWYSQVNKHFWQRDDAGVDTDLAAAGAATQVSNSAVSGAADYVARIKIAADTTYRAFLGLTAGDVGSLEFGPGGVAARDTFFRRNAAGRAQLTGAVGAIVLSTEAAVGQRSIIEAGLAGDTNARASLSGDATTAGVEMGSGAAARDVRLYRFGVGGILMDSLSAAAATDLAIRSTAGQRSIVQLDVAGDTVPRLFITGDATAVGAEFGPGGGAARDVRIFRTFAGGIELDANGSANAATLRIGGPVVQGNLLGMFVTGDTGYRLALHGDAGASSLEFGSGTGAMDTKLRRTGAAAVLFEATRVSASRPATTDGALQAFVTGDGDEQRFVIRAGGGVEWGSGAATPDTRFRRLAAGDLVLDGNGQANQSSLRVSATAGQVPMISINVSGDAGHRSALFGTGIEMGSGAGARDARIYRSGAKTVTADDTAGGNLTAFNVLGALQQGGVQVSLVGHGAADHANITRNVFLCAALAKLDAGTAANVGASPDLTGVVALADAATQGAFWTFEVPDDWNSGVITVQPVWSPGATDGVAHTVRWSIIAKAIAAGSTVTAAGTTVTFTGASAARTVGVVVYDTATSTTLTPGAAGDLFRVHMRRVGADAADTYVGVVNLLGIIITYTANQ